MPDLCLMSTPRKGCRDLECHDTRVRSAGGWSSDSDTGRPPLLLGTEKVVSSLRRSLPRRFEMLRFCTWPQSVAISCFSEVIGLFPRVLVGEIGAGAFDPLLCELLIWCGDLNVSHKDADVSHLEFFRSVKLAGYIPPNAEVTLETSRLDCGQPGFTAGERRRFSERFEQGNLVDAYRWLNQNKEDDCFTWSRNPVGKYRRKRMRIDSKKLLNQVISCEKLGHGIEQLGFYGSDHCPITMKLDSLAQNYKD